MLTREAVDKRKKVTGHSPFGGSSIPRIILCPGSVNEELKVAPSPSSPAAEHGTMLHEVMERELLGQPSEYLNLDIPDAAAIMECLEYVEKVEAEYTEAMMAQRGIEQETSLKTFNIKDVEGTADIVISSEIRVDIIDWKFGSGVPVDAYENMQGLVYAAGVMEFDDEHMSPDFPIYIHIAQPFLSSFTVWQITYKELLGYVERVRTAVNQAWLPNPPLNPGLKQCRFCDARMSCKERHAATKNDAVAVFSAMTAPQAVSDEQIGKLLEKATAIQQYIKDAQKYVADKLTKGEPFPGFKMVAGRGKRVWVDEVKAENWLIKEGFDDEQIYITKRTFITAPKAEKLDKKYKKNEELQALMLKVAGKPTVVPEADKRKALPNKISIFNK